MDKRETTRNRKNRLIPNPLEKGGERDVSVSETALPIRFVDKFADPRWINMKKTLFSKEQRELFNSPVILSLSLQENLKRVSVKHVFLVLRRPVSSEFMNFKNEHSRRRTWIVELLSSKHP